MNSLTPDTTRGSASAPGCGFVPQVPGSANGSGPERYSELAPPLSYRRWGFVVVDGAPRYFLAAFLIILLGVCGLRLVTAVPIFVLDEKILVEAEATYGPDARLRLLSWQRFIQEDTSSSDMEKLIKVNEFFNRLTFIDDILHWQKKDYWATPVEFLASDGGDCEDFSLAKYFTLKLLGVSEKKLNLTYVKAWKLNQAHMVVTYYASPAAEPLVLDNLISSIEPASKRDDLLPVFSFNGSGLWISKNRGKGELVGKSDRLKLWNDLVKRLPDALKQ